MNGSWKIWNSCSLITFGISPWEDNDVSCRQENTTDSYYLPGTTQHFSFLWSLGFTFSWPPRTLFIEIHFCTTVIASPPAGTLRKGLVISSTWSSHAQINPGLSSETQQLSTWGQLCPLSLAVTSTYITASHPSRSDECGQSTRQISNSRSKPIFLEAVITSGLFRHII